MSDTCVPSLIIICTAINQLETKNNLLHEAICCCLQTCNVLVSEVMVGETCKLSLVVIAPPLNSLVLYITNSLLFTNIYILLFLIKSVRHICI